MTYDKQILQILIEVGEKGISVQQMSKHIYNQNVSLFYTPDFEEIRTYVQQYLLKNSKSDLSLIESTGQRGCYRLNTTGSKDAQQLMLLFRDETVVSDEPSTLQEDMSLDLFDGMI